MAITIVVPELGESVVTATVGHWLKKEGDQVKAGETIVEVETDKVNLEVGAERTGVLAHIDKAEGQDVKRGDVLGTIDESVTQNAPAAPMPSGGSTGPQPVPDKGPVAREFQPGTPRRETEPSAAPNGDRATPVARRLAQDQGIDLAQVGATGAGGRVTRQDVESYLASAPAAKSETVETKEGRRELPPAAVSSALAPEPATRGAAREDRVRMSRRRRTIAERLLEATQTTAMLTTFNDVDMTAVMAIRQREKEAFKQRHGVSLGFTSFFVKTSIAALREFPQLNAEIQGDEIVYKHYYDIGVAVGAAEGLVVPVLRDADRMSLAQIEMAIKQFARKVDDKTLSVEDLRGGTFTVTNGGVFGSLLSTPIVNPPQVGILGLHRIEDRPVAAQGQVVIRPMMYVALSYDHRLVDGRDAVQFLGRIKQLIENPDTMLLEI